MEIIQVIGNLGADASVQNYQGRKFVTFRVGASRKYTSNGEDHTVTTWYDCTYNNAESKIIDYLKSGQKVYVSGQPTYRVYDSAKYHTKMVGVSIFVNTVELCGSSSDRQAPAQEQQPAQQETAGTAEVKPATVQEQNGQVVKTDDNGNPLPF